MTQRPPFHPANLASGFSRREVLRFAGMTALGVAAAVAPVWAQTVVEDAKVDPGAPVDPNAMTKSYGISTFGDLKYPADFAHLDYVNPQAPKGGEISEWLSGGFDSFNPFTIAGRAAALATWPLETLLTSNSDEIGAAYCLLAESVEYPASRDWVIFTIRKDAAFSNGAPVTAQDVLFSYDQLRTKGLSSYQIVVAQQVASAEVLDTNRIKFTFVDGYPRRDVIQAVGGLPIFCKADFEARGLDLEKPIDAPFVGSGPYLLESATDGRKLAWKRNPAYWGAAHPLNIGRNNFDRVTITYFADYQTAFEGFKAGNYTFRNEASSTIWANGYDFPAVEKGYVIKAQLPNHRIPTGQCFAINLRRPQFADIRTRQALGLMFNFDWANETLFYGLYARVTSMWDQSEMAAKGVPSVEELALLEQTVKSFPNALPEDILTAEAVLPPSSGARQLDRKNMRAAGNLLEDAGWIVGKDGMRRNGAGEMLRVEILNDSQTFDRVLNPYVENLRAIGVDAIHSRVDDVQYEARKSKHDFDLITTHLGQDAITGADLEQYFGSSSVGDTFNAMGLANTAVDDLILNVIAAKTRPEMELAARVLDRALRSLHFWIPQWFAPTYNVAYYDMFDHPETLPAYALGELDFWWYNAEKAEKLKAQGAL